MIEFKKWKQLGSKTRRFHFDAQHPELTYDIMVDAINKVIKPDELTDYNEWDAHKSFIISKRGLKIHFSEFYNGVQMNYGFELFPLKEYPEEMIDILGEIMFYLSKYLTSKIENNTAQDEYDMSFIPEKSDVVVNDKKSDKSNELSNMTLSKAQLEKILNSLLKGLKMADVEEEGWYNELIWQNFEEPDNDPLFKKSSNIEDYFAMQAVKYPELIPVVRKIVTNLMDLIEEEDDENFIVDGEWCAGVSFAKHLALAEPNDIPLFTRYFINTDADHVENGFDCFYPLIEHYGWQKKSIPILLAPFFVGSQHSSELFTISMCKEITVFLQDDKNMNDFLAMLANWTSKYNNNALHELFSVVLDKALNITKKTDVKKLAKDYAKLVGKSNVPTKQDVESLIAQCTN